MKRFLSLTLTLAMLGSMTVFADEDTKVITASGDQTITTDFGVVSPTVTVSVPVSANIRVNPLYESTTNGTLDEYQIASNELKITNYTADAPDGDGSTNGSGAVGSFTTDSKGYKVLVTAKANIKSKGSGVVTYYNKPAAALSDSSANKEVYLQLTDGGASGSFGSSATSSPITSYGSRLQFDIAAPTSLDTSAAYDSADPSNSMTATSGSFAITGYATTGADWQANDLAVELTYNIKASSQTGLNNPTVAAVTLGSSNPEITLTKSDLDGATVAGIAAHNDASGKFGEFKLTQNSDYVVEEQTNGDLKVTLNAAGNLKNFKTTGYVGEAQDFVIVLSDGRVIVTTITGSAS